MSYESKNVMITKNIWMLFCTLSIKRLWLQVNGTIHQRSKVQWATGQLLYTSTKTGWCMESNTNKYALQVNRSECQPSLDYVSIWKHFALQVNQTHWSKEHIPLENDLQFNQSFCSCCWCFYHFVFTLLHRSTTFYPYLLCSSTNTNYSVCWRC